MRNVVTVSTGTLDWDRPATWTGAIDRSPCGTGTSARMATLHARGALGVGDAFRHEGILGTVFTGRVVEETRVGRVPGDRPDHHGPGLDHRLRVLRRRPDRPIPRRLHDRRHLGMKLGIVITTGDPRTAADLAAEAEAAGWDGAFYWDAIAIRRHAEIYDPWVVMAAMAMRTERVTLGAILSPPSRRRPWKLARETMTLDRLSNGRLVVPVGLGALDDPRLRQRRRADRREDAGRDARRIAGDPRGAVVGRAVRVRGRHYRFEPMTFRPTPIQRPRIPIWVVGQWPKERSVARALRFDGILPETSDPGARSGRSPSASRGNGPGAVRHHGRGEDADDPARRGGDRAARRGRRDLVDRGRLVGRHVAKAAAARSPPGRRGSATDGAPRPGRTTAGAGRRAESGGRTAARAEVEEFAESMSGSTLRSAVSPFRRAHSAKKATRRVEMIRASLHGQPCDEACASGRSLSPVVARRSNVMSTVVCSVHLGRREHIDVDGRKVERGALQRHPREA